MARDVIDTSTGEIVTGQYRLININTIKAFEDKQNRDTWLKRQPSFVFSEMDEMHHVYKALTTSQCGYLLILQCYLDYDGRLVNTDNSLMTKSDVIRALRISPRAKSTFYDFFNKCLEYGIIYKEGKGYLINKRYHFRGKSRNHKVIRSYITKVKKAYRQIKIVDLGLIYRMLPLVHMKTNTLCENPYESNPELIKPFNRNGLAEAINISPTEISRRLPRLAFGDEYVIAKTTVGGKTSYMLNPWVFYRMQSEPDDSLKAIFAVKVR